jgi:hypothetical protein
VGAPSVAPLWHLERRRRLGFASNNFNHHPVTHVRAVRIRCAHFIEVLGDAVLGVASHVLMRVKADE